MVELAEALRHPISDLTQFAREQRLLHRANRAPGRHPVWYVTEHGAARLIIYARNKQGEAVLDPKCREAMRERRRLVVP